MYAFTDTLTHDAPAELLGVHAIINTNTGAVVELYHGTPFAAMDVAAYRSKNSIGTTQGATLYTTRTATVADVVVSED